MKIFYSVLIVSAGISFASASEVPKEGTYDYIACYSGTTATVHLPGGDAQTRDFMGIITAKTPGSLFDNMTFHCLSTGIMKNRLMINGRTFCEATDADGDKRYTSFVTDENGKPTKTNLPGTGKYEGIEIDHMTVVDMPPAPTIVPGTIQGCNHQTGNYKLK